MIAEVISIGDELTSGQRLDTNSQWLSERLGELGVRVMYHSTVADDLAANVAVFRHAVQRADIVVASGGLGPTADDLTREAIAEVAGKPLILDEASLEYIRGLFARFKRDMPERNRVQALFPEGSQIIFNPNGTAPGIWIDIPRTAGGVCHVFALPGVPAELFEMFKATVAPAVLSYQDVPRLIRHYRVKVFGAGESHVEQMLPDLIRRGREPSVGITVSAATITLRITASGATPEECLAMIDPTVGTIRECLGNLVYGDEDDELEDAVVRLLKSHSKTLCTVEYATAGIMAEWLSRASAREECYLGGHVIRSTAMLESELGDSASLIQSAGPSSREVVETLASICRARSGADYCLVVGPFPEPTAADPAPPYHFALATPDKIMVKASNMAGHNSIWLPRAAKAALNLLRLELLGAMH